MGWATFWAIFLKTHLVAMIRNRISHISVQGQGSKREIIFLGFGILFPKKNLGTNPTTSEFTTKNASVELAYVCLEIKYFCFRNILGTMIKVESSHREWLWIRLLGIPTAHCDRL
jgi:hypothetical protein